MAEGFVAVMLLLAVASVLSVASGYYTRTEGALPLAELSLLLVGAIVRLVVRGFETRRLRDDPAPHPEVMPQAGFPAGALAKACFALAGIYE